MAHLRMPYLFHLLWNSFSRFCGVLTSSNQFLAIWYLLPTQMHTQYTASKCILNTQSVEVRLGLSLMYEKPLKNSLFTQLRLQLPVLLRFHIITCGIWHVIVHTLILQYVHDARHVYCWCIQYSYSKFEPRKSSWLWNVFDEKDETKPKFYERIAQMECDQCNVDLDMRYFSDKMYALFSLAKSNIVNPWTRGSLNCMHNYNMAACLMNEYVVQSACRRKKKFRLN